MLELMPYIWIGVIVFSAISEIHARSFVAVVFIPAALASFTLSLMGRQVWIQTAVFFIAALILFFLSRIFLRRLKKRRNTDAISNSDLFTGKNAIVITEINNHKNTGTVRLDGFTLNARAAGDDVIYETGLVVTVIHINADTNTAICAR